MKIKTLSATNLRALKNAELKFNPRMTLLVGVNGLGKTTILDAIRIVLAQVLPHVNGVRGDHLAFSVSDIRISNKKETGSDALSVELNCVVPGAKMKYTWHKPRTDHAVIAAGSVRNPIREKPEQQRLEATAIDGSKVVGIGRETQLAVYFSTRRSLASDRRASKGRTASDRSAALSEALSSRELRLAELAYWMKAQEELGREEPKRQRHLAAMCRAARKFLPACKRIWAETSPSARLFILKGKTKLDVRQLSDGERGMLALVLDLARRMSQARPDARDPVSEVEAVVLIDELDLHLHPQWQRTIVPRLTRTFPRCQFIATTHSPQIIAAVKPEQIVLLTPTGLIEPDRSLGMDSNWILKHVMGTDERPARTAQTIRGIEAQIDSGSFRSARAAIAKARKIWSDLPDWPILEMRMKRMEDAAG
ncbi:MAG: hypothetical protein JWM32_3106 [Verrucomicrobia bacterium]|nr:hypothetical protein [Verrucomicrobiota bacterium]